MANNARDKYNEIPELQWNYSRILFPKPSVYDFEMSTKKLEKLCLTIPVSQFL